MRQPPPLSMLPHYPVVGGLALLSLAVTVAGWAEVVDVSPLLATPHIWEGQVWRLFTSILIHADFMHLAFNLYWLWVLGSVVEEEFGHLRTLGIVLFLAIGSMAPEYALLYGGVGLSGVGYGLAGMLWVLSRRDERFRGAMDRDTAALFVAWFFICILLTVTNVYPVGNIAHGAGAVLGALLGLAVSARRVRGTAVALAVVVPLAAGGAALYARPYINLTKERGWELSRLGYLALERDRDREAVRHLEAAVRVDESLGTAWFNLGLAHQRLGRRKEASEAYRRAVELEPRNDEFREALEDIEGPLKAE